MLINNVIFNADLEYILSELQAQLALNNIPLLRKTRNATNDIQVQCPYHANGQERKPSAGIRRSDGMFHCFACGETHSLAEVVSFCFGHEDGGLFGWKWLLKNFATMSVEERKDIELDFSRANRSINAINNGINMANKTYVTEDELDSYRYIHPYMYERGLTDEVIEFFDIGYDKDTDCITFPNRDINGNTLFVARRSVKTKFFNYPEGVEKPLYGLYEYYKLYTTRIVGGRSNGKTEFLRRLNEIRVTESMLDALAFWVVGKFAVALNGTGDEYQYQQLRDGPWRTIILATDNDREGRKARQRIRENVTNKIITECVFPEGCKDANECLMKYGREVLNTCTEIF